MKDKLLDFAKNYYNTRVYKRSRPVRERTGEETPIQEEPLYKLRESSDTTFNPKEIPDKLRDFYNRTRLVAHVDEDGDYIVPYYNRYLAHPDKELQDILKAFPLEEYTNTIVIPKDIVKRLDHQYTDYNKKARAIFSNIGHYDKSQKFLGNLGKMIPLKGLNNISSSVDMERALDEIMSMMCWYEMYREKASVPDDYTGSLSSMRKVREKDNEFKENVKTLYKIYGARDIIDSYNLNSEGAKLPPEEAFRKMTLAEQEAEIKKNSGVGEHLIHLTPDQQERLIRSIEGARRNVWEDFGEEEEEDIDVKGMVQEAYNYAHRDFKYAPDIKKAVEGAGWELLPSYPTLCKRADAYGLCLEQSKYDEKIDNKNTLVLTRGKDTAEISLALDKYGTITAAEVVQIKGPYNEELMYNDNYDDDLESGYSDDFEDLSLLASELVGMNVNDDEGMEKVISDIFAKHIIQPASPHLVSAINRRF